MRLIPALRCALNEVRTVRRLSREVGMKVSVIEYLITAITELNLLTKGEA